VIHAKVSLGLTSISMDIEALYQRGFELRCEGNYPGAKECFVKVLATEPSHVNTRHQMALIVGFEGDFDGSLSALEILCTQYPQNLDVRYDFAMTQMMLGMYEEACANLKFILAKDPTNAKALQQVTYC
jgi:tetratricopeptide (TPR) repeat protein